MSEVWDKRISYIFAKFEGRYGSLFLDRWRGCDQINVKATWAEAIAKFSHQAERIEFALNALEAERFPPTLPEFVSAMRQTPIKEPVKLDRKPTPEEEERARSAISEAATVLRSRRGEGINTGWAMNPRSPAHARMILEASRRDARYRVCVAALIERGIMTSEGKLLRPYDAANPNLLVDVVE